MFQYKNKLLTKIFMRYIIIFACISTALILYFLYEIKQINTRNNQEKLFVILENSVNYIEDCYGEIVDLQKAIYRSEYVSADIYDYLTLEHSEYTANKLDRYSNMELLQYPGFDELFLQRMNQNTNILSIELLSLKNDLFAIYEPGDKVSVSDKGESRMKEINDLSTHKKEIISFNKTITDPYTLEIIGYMTINFSTSNLQKIHDMEKDISVTIYGHNGFNIFSGNNNYVNKSANHNDQTALRSKIYMQRYEVEQLDVYTYITKENAEKIPNSQTMTILLLGIIVIIILIFIMRIYIKRAEKRIDHVIEAMSKITKGNLEVRLEYNKNGDELDIISTHFNEMCYELDKYIKQSYLAELEQKDAEMEALQNQINPHFLYNTLEVIRMKAIANQDREVGRMLFLMATLFRNQLKSNNIITLSQEIHYCKSYIELMTHRYDKCFTYQIDCDETFLHDKVIKFILQPIIENYFLHGLRTENHDNYIRIEIEKEEQDLKIHIIDNGRGMEQSEIDLKNKQLNKIEDLKIKQSVGIKNVNRRIKAIYGEDYGITLQKSNDNGLHVTVCLRIGGRDV